MIVSQTMAQKWSSSTKGYSSDKLKLFILDTRGLTSKDFRRLSKEDDKWLFAIWHLGKEGLILKGNESENDLTDCTL